MQKRSTAAEGVSGKKPVLGHVWFASVAVVLLVATMPGLSQARATERGADGRFDQRRSSHFVLYQDVAIDHRSGWHGSIRFEREVLAALETAYGRLDRFLGLRPERPVVVVLYDPVVFDREFAPFFRFAAAGFYQGTIRIRGDTQVTGSLLHVLHHELLHAALDQAAAANVFPAWLNEGLAEWFAYRSFGKRHLESREVAALHGAARARALHGFGDLANPTWARMNPRDARTAYLQSYALVEYLARRFGEDSLRELCQKLLHMRNLERSLRRVYRTDLEGVQADFLRELEGAAVR